MFSDEEVAKWEGEDEGEEGGGFLRLLCRWVLESLTWSLSCCWLVPSCFMIFDLEPLSLTLSLVPRSLNLFLVCLYRLCHLAILCLDQHAHTLYHLKSLLTISFDNLYLNNLDIFKEDLESQSCGKSRKSPTAELFNVDSGRISIVTVNTKEYHSDVLAKSQGYCVGLFVITCVLDVEQQVFIKKCVLTRFID
ncbi:hypothetical protein Tco_0974398 [Tanacetum coccineum]|uniref:Uncharacterized protein n=1 Tax=Tanacetum coccineum TaxID=301880 RepID=A0ABQ5EBH8_9ASTR